ncbi:MAG: type IV secretion system protein VirB9 [Candidatus Midichloriaceae bacterium]|jgi:type IV secretion system protein VirB9
MKTRKILFLFLLICNCCIFNSVSFEKPLSTDSRIKTFIYNENEIFKVVIHYNYQTSIEFEKDEEIKTISSGNNYAWQLTPVGNRLFIKPIEDTILTNMTLITSKRVYQFEIESKPYSNNIDNELVYVVRFFYPTKYDDIIKPKIKKDTNQNIEIQPYNFNYKIIGPVKFSPTKVFDDGVKTYFYYKEDIRLNKPKIRVVQKDKVSEMVPKIVGDYLVLNTVGEILELSFGKNIIEITNNNYNH